MFKYVWDDQTWLFLGGHGWGLTFWKSGVRIHRFAIKSLQLLEIGRQYWKQLLMYIFNWYLYIHTDFFGLGCPKSPYCITLPGVGDKVSEFSLRERVENTKTCKDSNTKQWNSFLEVHNHSKREIDTIGEDQKARGSLLDHCNRSPRLEPEQCVRLCCL